MRVNNNFGLAPFIILTFIYFIVGFLTTVNGQFQAPLQMAFLFEVETLRNTLTTLIPFFFFLGYLINSSLGGRWIDRVGYKRTLVRAMLFMVAGLIFYLASAVVATNYISWGIFIGADYIPYGYLIFLVGSFSLGTSAAILQVVINPYINAYELANTQPVQRMNIVCGINSIGTTIAPFFVTGVLFAGVAIADVEASQLVTPFALMAIFVALVTAITQRLRLPDVEGTFNTDDSLPKRNIWSFSHLRLGVVAIFFYVGAEVAIGVNVNLYALELGFSNPALLATLYWGGLMVGRLLSSFVSNISARTQLIVTSIAAIVMTIIAIFSQNLWVLVAIGLCHSVMWGAIFSLSVVGLGKYTSKASGVFMMGVFGGAVFPLLQGLAADTLGSWQWTWTMVIICEGVILYYALIGSRIKQREL